MEAYAGGVRDRDGPGRRAARGCRAATSVFFGGGTPSRLPGRPAASRARRRAPTTGGRGHRRVQPRGRDRAPAGHVPRRRGDPDLPRRPVHRGPRAGGPRPPPRPGHVAEAAALVAGAGFDSWNLDLILGGAGETDEDWERSLADLLGPGRAPPPHLSAYALTVEPGTPLGRDPSRHPDDDVQADALRAGRPGARRRRVPVGGDLQLGPARPRVPAQPPLLGPGRLPRDRVGGPLPPGRAPLVERPHARTATWRWSARTLDGGRRGGARRAAGASRPWPWRCGRRPACRSTALPDDPDLEGLVDRSTGGARADRAGPPPGQCGDPAPGRRDRRDGTGGAPGTIPPYARAGCPRRR